MITIDDLIGKIREIASEEPDFKYRTSNDLTASCSYFGPIGGGEGSGCIVGRALIALDVDMSKVRECEDDPNTPTSIDELLYERVVDVAFKEDECDKVLWVDRVQSRQDSGDTWDEAVNFADKVAGLTEDV